MPLTNLHTTNSVSSALADGHHCLRLFYDRFRFTEYAILSACGLDL